MTKIKDKYSLFLLFIVLLFTTGFSYSQSDEYQLKALLVLSIAEETTWSNENQIEVFNISVVGDRDVYAKLNVLKSSKTIHGRRFNVNFLSTMNVQPGQHIVVINKSMAPNNSFHASLGKNILSIVEDNDSYAYSCVNIFLTKHNQLAFTVNANEFETQLLLPSPSLLVYATNKSDAIRLINKAEQELNELKEDYRSQLAKYNALHDQMDQLREEVSEQERKNKELKAAIKQRETELTNKDNEYVSLEQRIDLLMTEYALTHTQLERASHNLLEKAEELEVFKQKLNTQKSKIEENEKTLVLQKGKIEEQELLLEKSGDVISSKNRTVWLITGITLLLLVILFFIFRENRARRKSLALINSKNQEILEASRHKDEFISNLSHEVRTPLNVIIGYTNLVQEHITNEQDKIYLENVTLSSKNLLRIINDILDLKKIESGKLELENEDFELKDVVLETFQLTKLLVARKNIDYILDYDDKLPAMVLGDPIKINQILLNFLSNAAKFTEEGEIKLIVRMLEEKKDEINVMFEVSDTGIGISQDKIEKIFESFSQGDEDIAKRYGGTGLGLSIAKKFINLMGGEINVKSELNIGSKFTFNIPLKKSTGMLKISTMQMEINKHALDGVRIAYADDLPINRDLFVRQIKGISDAIHVEVASNGEELVKLVLGKEFDIVITDIQMPVMNGIDATKLIRSNNKDIKIIGLSARVLKREIDQYLEAGMNDYITKPYALNNLILKVSEQLGIDYKAAKEAKGKAPELKEAKRFGKIWSISENEEEYNSTLHELIDDIRNNLKELEQQPNNAASAHALVNKVIYLDQEQLLQYCKDYEYLCHIASESTATEIQTLSKNITSFLKDIS